MAVLSSNLFSLGVILVALGFAAHVGHAVMLANGRRLLPSLADGPADRAQPAYAGVVTGSFVERADTRGLRAASTRTPRRAPCRGRRSGWRSPRSWRSARRCSCAALVVGRGPWGNMFEFSVAFAFSMIGGYLFLQRRYPIRSIGFIPTRRRARRCCSTRRACRPRSRRSSRRSRTRRC